MFALASILSLVALIISVPIFLVHIIGTGMSVWGKKIKEKIQSHNDLESYVYSIRNQFNDWNDLGGKATHDEKKAIETGIDELKKSLEGTDSEDIKKKTQNLIQVSMKLGEAVYKSQQKDQTKSADPKKDKKDVDGNDKENVVDADFEDVKEDKEKSA